MLYSQLRSSLDEIYDSGVAYAARIQAISSQRPHYQMVLLRQLDQMLYLKRVNHPLQLMVNPEAIQHNFEFIEAGVNAVASPELQNMVSVAQGVQKIYKKFYPRADGEARKFDAIFRSTPNRTEFYSRKMDAGIEAGMELILEIGAQLVKAEAND